MSDAAARRDAGMGARLRPEADIRVHAVRSVCGCRCEQVAPGEWRTVEPCEHHDEAAAMERAFAAAPRERQGEEA